MLCQPAADRARLLRPEIERDVLLALVEETELCAVVRIDDGQNTGDGLADIRSVLLLDSALFPSRFHSRRTSVSAWLMSRWRPSECGAERARLSDRRAAS